MGIQFGREISGDRHSATAREWLVTNGIGGYASGTISGHLTRCYHGLLVAALNPPLGRTLLVTKIDEVAHYGTSCIELSTNYWHDGAIAPQGFRHIEHFSLDDTIPVWQFAFADVCLEKRIWMQQGANTTYVQYALRRASQPVQLTLNGFVNYRDHHSRTQGQNWQMEVTAVESGIRVTAYPGATPVYLLSNIGTATPTHTWYYGYDLSVERYRGLVDHDDHLHAVTFDVTLKPGSTMTLVASIDPQPILDGHASLRTRRDYEQSLINRWQVYQSRPLHSHPDWVRQLVLAADQFIVDRALLDDNPHGKTIIAGYHWFGDWGRDTMISLPGLTLSTGRPEIARSILHTFAQYVDQGMLPNRFPDGGDTLEYNTVDATLWYFEALRLYYAATEDEDLLRALFPVLADIIDWHCRGTRYAIHLDPADGLLYAGVPDVQLTWMDAKVGDWVVTPRIGKPIEVNALWYNALRTMAKFARRLGKPHQEYEAIANRTLARFDRFWNEAKGYCYDVIDSPSGDDGSLRPNQLFAILLPLASGNGYPPLLSLHQQRQVVDACGRALLTSYGLRSLSPDHNDYQGHYGGDQLARDGAYHQGTTWGWLLGPFAIAYMHVYGDASAARDLLAPIADHLSNHGLGSLSEIFDGDAPFNPRGCIAQAWTVAEILRAWMELS